MTATSRNPRPRVWCCCWQTCGNVDVPGSDGPGGELCEACAAKYHPELALASRTPTETPVEKSDESPCDR